MEQLQTYWNILSKRWWLVLALALAGAAAGYGLSKLQPPVFRSAAKLYVMPARPDYGNTYFSQNVVRQYGQLVGSDYFLKKVNDALNLGLSPDLLRSKVVTSGNVEHLTISLTVDDADPARAQSIARQLTREFVQDQELRMKDITPEYRVDVRVYDDATTGVLYRPVTGANTFASGLLGLLVGVVLAVFWELFDDTIKTPEDVVRYVGVPVLGNIPSAS